MQGCVCVGVGAGHVGDRLRHVARYPCLLVVHGLAGAVEMDRQTSRYISNKHVSNSYCVQGTTSTFM